MRTANLIRHGDYLGVQLHPKDTGGAMIEFNRTAGGEDPMGPYAPAGPRWQRAIRRDVTRRLAAAEIECAEPAPLRRALGRSPNRCPCARTCRSGMCIVGGGMRACCALNGGGIRREQRACRARHAAASKTGNGQASCSLANRKATACFT